MSRSSIRRWMVAVATTAVLASVGMAKAEAQIAPGDPRDRLTGGVASGVGLFFCETQIEPPCDNGAVGLAQQASIGWMLTPRVAVTAEGLLSGLLFGDGLALATLGPQLWIFPRLWIRPGLGVALATRRLNSSFFGDPQIVSTTTAGASVAIGQELVTRSHFGLDIRVIAASVLDRDSAMRATTISSSVGFQWF